MKSSRRLFLQMWVWGVALGLSTASGDARAQNAGDVGMPEAVDANSGSLRPKVLVWVEGSAEENTIWRGWPALVRVQALSDGVPADVRLEGAGAGALVRAKTSWVISAAESAKLTLGTHALSAGGQTIDVTVADAPRTLTTAQAAERFRLLVLSALALGDAAAAKKAAGEWLQAEPKSHAANEALGDAWRAEGKTAEALAAYNQAVRFLPRDVEPLPAGLFGKITALVNEGVDALPKQPARALTADELKYFQLIEAGDGAVAAGKGDVARQRYAEAGAWRREKALSIAALEPEDTQAFSAPVVLPTATGQTPGAGVVVNPPGAPAAVRSSEPAVGVIVPVVELVEAKILADARGQWASAATASTEYGAPNYGAIQMVGAPNVPVGGDSMLAWCHGSSAKGAQWVELSFAKPVRATEVRVRQNYNPGAIVKVEGIDTKGVAHLWWSGIDPARPPGALNEIAWFAVRVPKTDYVIARVRITLDIDAVASWQEIDAVQLVGVAE